MVLCIGLVAREFALHGRLLLLDIFEMHCFAAAAPVLIDESGSNPAIQAVVVGDRVLIGLHRVVKRAVPEVEHDVGAGLNETESETALSHCDADVAFGGRVEPVALIGKIGLPQTLDEVVNRNAAVVARKRNVVAAELPDMHGVARRKGERAAGFELRRFDIPAGIEASGIKVEASARLRREGERSLAPRQSEGAAFRADVAARGEIDAGGAGNAVLTA